MTKLVEMELSDDDLRALRELAEETGQTVEELAAELLNGDSTDRHTAQ